MVTVPPFATQNFRALAVDGTTRFSGQDEPAPGAGAVVTGGCGEAGGDPDVGGVGADHPPSGGADAPAEEFDDEAHAPRTVETSTVAVNPTSAVTTVRARDVALGRVRRGQAVISMGRTTLRCGSRPARCLQWLSR